MDGKKRVLSNSWAIARFVSIFINFSKIDKSAPQNRFGYNAATGEYGDMVEMGILDPTKVTRTALQNVASVAGLMLTTEAMVAEEDKEPMGGGMGDMGGMGGMM